MIRRLRLANLRKLLRDRNGPILPDDDAGREYLLELLLPISIGPYADIKMPNAIEVWAPWMQKGEATQLIDHINRMPIWERKPTATTLGQRLALTNPDRERLKLWTIAPSDMGERGMAWWRKHKDKQRKHRLRQLNGAKSQGTSISKSKPWLELGIKRSTWYSQYRWTTSSEVKLISSKDKTVQAERRRVSEEGVAAKRASPTSTEHLVQQVEKTQMPATDTASSLTDEIIQAEKNKMAMICGECPVICRSSIRRRQPMNGLIRTVRPLSSIRCDYSAFRPP
jgi:hypothetical protein